MTEISIVVVTYNSLKWIGECLNALSNQSLSDSYEIIIVDNNSTDGTPGFIESHFPTVNVIHADNRGFGAGNNLGAKHASGMYIAFVNPDTIPADNWLKELVSPLKNDSKLVTTSKITLPAFPDQINTCGNRLHFTGYGFVNHYKEKAANFDTNFAVDGISGAAFAISKKNFEELGGFDETFFMYMEDVELSWRIRKAGMRVLCVASSVVQHHYELELNPRKIQWLEKGRIRLLKKHLTPLQWCILFPSIFLSFMLSLVRSTSLGISGVTEWSRAISLIFSSKTSSPGWSQENSSLNYFTDQVPFDSLGCGRLTCHLGVFVNILFALNYMALWRKKKL